MKAENNFNWTKAGGTPPDLSNYVDKTSIEAIEALKIFNDGVAIGSANYTIEQTARGIDLKRANTLANIRVAPAIELDQAVNLSQLNKYDQYVGTFNVNWESKDTVAWASSINFADVVGAELWAIFKDPANKYKYYIQAFSGDNADGDKIELPLEAYNIQSSNTRQNTFYGQNSTTSFATNNPAITRTIALQIAINDAGNVYFNALYDDALNANFNVYTIIIFKKGQC